ncbi:Gfo/Idh/MocA family oxidoreductase [Nocardiopsis sp. ATB16-24]|uniref:Gfo/Idh/MocA family oxidoreductase n=1 Tax=Nocardiopsis sp. ATB16-24 TaxID=3019555 RepID=UPI002554E81C|nr:Gfo/Idh/MocA family oxidoreductase [Nocardiopsis sp. ATB16-24]
MTPQTTTIPWTWTVLHGPLTPERVAQEATDIAARHHLHLVRTPNGLLLTEQNHEDDPLLRVGWRPHTPTAPDTLTHTVPADQVEILIHHQPTGATAATDLTEALNQALACFTHTEQEQISAAMPLLDRFTPDRSHLADWAIIVRDHYVENTLGLIQALLRAGVPAQWIYALDKGDATLRRARIHATLRQLGCASGVLDNTTINAPHTHAAELAEGRRAMDAFIKTAHQDDRRVMVIDDGGLIAQGYGRADAAHRVDAAVELTVSGLKRIKDAEVDIPVFNLARSALKLRLGYAEIADSCLRRLRALVPAVKMIGRPVLVLGHGALGSRLSRALADQGCQVHVVDPDPLALIEAAEAGQTTHPTLTRALERARPVVIAGTTGERALTEEALSLLPSGAFLAPFASADFSLLAEHPHTVRVETEVPGIGRRYRLSHGCEVTVLGNGRSLNLFEADAIPTQGYDAYRAGTLVAADALASLHEHLSAGVHTEPVDHIVRESGLYQAYYDTYLAAEPPPTTLETPGRALANPVVRTSACVVGYGKIGRLHTQILAEQGAELTVIDPKHQDLPKTYRSFPHGVDGLPPAVRSSIGLWSVCTPTTDHLPVLRSILAHDPQARVLLEKPACLGHEISDFQELLKTHPEARIVVTDQYRHARALDVLREVMDRFEPDPTPTHVAVTFVKDRSADIALGRFVDRSYGVLGYEWLHMLTVLRGLLDEQTGTAYFATAPANTDLLATYHKDLFVSALTERTHLSLPTGPLHIDLTSSIATPTLAVGHRTTPDASRPFTDRHRKVTIHAGRTRFTVFFDPVTLPGGDHLGLNRHLVQAERDGVTLHEEVVDDSPLHTAVRDATTKLLGTGPMADPDLSSLHRISAIADLLRANQPLFTQPSAAHG